MDHLPIHTTQGYYRVDDERRRTEARIAGTWC